MKLKTLRYVPYVQQSESRSHAILFDHIDHSTCDCFCLLSQKHFRKQKEDRAITTDT